MCDELHSSMSTQVSGDSLSGLEAAKVNPFLHWHCFGDQKIRNMYRMLSDVTSKLSSEVGTQIELSPQFAVPSWHGFERSVIPTLLTVEMRTAFSCE